MSGTNVETNRIVFEQIDARILNISVSKRSIFSMAMPKKQMNQFFGPTKNKKHTHKERWRERKDLSR